MSGGDTGDDKDSPLSAGPPGAHFGHVAPGQSGQLNIDKTVPYRKMLAPYI